MTFVVRVRREAEHDLETIQDWYEDQEPGLGSRFRAVVDQAVERIGVNPFLYQDVYRGTRRVVLRPFRHNLWYRIRGATVTVVACTHGRRGVRYVGQRLRST